LRSSEPPLLGKTTPRIWTPPLVTGRPGPCGCGCALTPETSLGFSAVDFSRDVLGVEPLPWQRWLFIHAFELRPDGRFRYRTVLILVARQNGKTTLVEVKNLWKLFVLQIRLVLGTAQNLDVSEESWDKAVEIIESIPDLNAELVQVNKVNGKKFFKLANGARWKVAAASRKGGRGLSGDDVNLDELREHHVWDSWAAVTKTTMARPNPQVFAFSNAGDDRSIVLNYLVEQGRAAAANPEAADPTLGMFEWSAPDDIECTCARRHDEPHKANCRLRDRQAWAQANPSLGYTILEEAIESALNTDPDPVFRTEVLCQRVPDMIGKWTVIPAADWEDAHDPLSAIAGRPAFGLSVSWTRDRATIGGGGARSDGLLHGEVIDTRPGTGWVVERFKDLIEKWNPTAIVVDPNTPAGSLIPDLEAAGIEVTTTTLGEVARGFGIFYDGVSGKEYVDDDGKTVNPRNVRHRGQDELTDSVAIATERSVGEGRAWDLKKANGDVTAVDSVTKALLGHALHGHGPDELFIGAWR